jgi:hypothetical protein
LLAGLIDYAGLFPPASLSMADAVSRYARYRRGPHAWMLGRFIVPCRRLDELEADMHAQGLLADNDGGAASAVAAAAVSTTASAEAEPWRLSVLASDDAAADRVAIEAFNARHRASASGAGGAGAASRACIDTVEVKVDAAPDVSRIAGTLDGVPRLWFEVAPGPALGSMLEAMASVGQRAGAKLRTGGTTPDAIPAAGDVARFVLACTRAGVACKATAGLHHPIHGPHRLTYADDSPTAWMHGFVNLFLAATLARVLMPFHHTDETIVDALVALLAERDAQHFVWHDQDVEWRGRYQLGVRAIASTREAFAYSFGSCSFEEPIEDLEQLGWL